MDRLARGGNQMDRLADIEATIAELEKLREAEDKREQRIFDEVAGVYEGREKIGLPATLAPIFKKFGVEVRDIQGLFNSQEQEARRLVEMATPQLQLNKEELKFIERQTRAVLVINPCAMVRNSPGWICAFHAASCNWIHSETANATGTCACNTPNNECNPKVEAYGQGLKGWRSAYVHSFCYFVIPARPNPATVHVYSLVDVHGFYVLRSVVGEAGFSLDLEMKGFQYGWSWASATSNVLSLSGDTMGRYDGHRHLQFVMPVGGGDPFIVRISAKLRARAKRGGALAVGDFGTGAGNLIKRIYVNTYTE